MNAAAYMRSNYISDCQIWKEEYYEKEQLKIMKAKNHSISTGVA